MFLQDAYRLAIKFLKLPNRDPALEARLLLQHILQLNPLQFFSAQHVELNKLQLTELHRLITLKNTGYPTAYILGYKDFWNYRFLVNENVLIPRPETETLISAVLQTYLSNGVESAGKPLKILDIGTGSGCILLTLLKEIPNSFGVGIDISKGALQVCQQNVVRLQIDPKRIVLLNQDLFSNLNVAYQFDIIVSNPPYIDIHDTQVETHVKQFEPNVALFAADNGLAIYSKIFAEGCNYLKSNGTLFLEIGKNQKKKVVFLNHNDNLFYIKSFKDDLNIDRVLLFRKQ